MNKKLLRSSDAYLLSFLIPVLVMLVIFFAREIYPFGEESFLRTDMYHQYAPFFSEFQEKLRHGGSLLYSWNTGLGMNFTALYSYYLASPLNFLILLFPKSLVLEFMTGMIVWKIGLSGLSACHYFRKHYKRVNFGCAFFGILYAMSGYIAAYSWNIMWLDCILLFPLILLGLERLCAGGSPLLYTLSLGISILSNYYISIMICLFLVLYFLCGLLLRGKEGIEGLLPAVGRFALYSLLAGGIAAVTLLPEIYALRATASGEINFPDTAKQYFTILDMLARHLPAVETEQGLEHWPNIYSGTAVLLLLPLYFMNPGISLRKKLLNLLFLLFFYLSFSINILNFIWHGFHYPNSLPCRQSFLYIFLVLRMSYEAYLKRRLIGGREIGGAAAMALGFVLLCQRLADTEAYHWSVFYLAIFFVLLYYILMRAEQKGRGSYNILLMSALALLTAETAVNMTVTSVTTTSRTAYTADNKDVRALTERIRKEDESFYRIEKHGRKTKNDGAWMNFPSVSVFSSTAYKQCTDFFRLIGCEASTNAYSITGSTPLVNMLFSVKYELYSGETEASGERGLSYAASSGETYLYQTDLSLPAGWMMTEKQLEHWRLDMGTPALVQNSLCDAMHTRPVLQNVLGSFSEEGYEFVTQTEGEYYVYVNNKKIKNAKVYIDSGDKSFENLDRGFFMELGWLPAGESVRIHSETKNQSMDCSVYRFDYEALRALYGELSREGLMLTEKTDTRLSGEIYTKDGGMMLSSIPYDKGWTAYVDGVKQEPEKLLDAFLGLRLTGGRHRIELVYFPEGLKLGSLISILSLLLLLLCLFLHREGKRRRERKHAQLRRRERADCCNGRSGRAAAGEADERSGRAVGGGAAPEAERLLIEELETEAPAAEADATEEADAAGRTEEKEESKAADNAAENGGEE